MELDKPQFDAAQIAGLAQIKTLQVHTWTTRGLANPYGSDIRRGRGEARFYTLRDALKFYIMGRLHEQYRMPLPQGLKICRHVFNDFNQARTDHYLVLKISTRQTVVTEYYGDAKSLTAALASKPLGTVINIARIWGDVSAAAEKILNTP